MKQDIASLKSGVHKLNVGFAQLRGEFAEMRADIRALQPLKSDLKRILAYLESFSGVIEAARTDRKAASDLYMMHQDRLDEHERRLARLESKKS